MTYFNSILQKKFVLYLTFDNKIIAIKSNETLVHVLEEFYFR